jgi:hypothetical protein
MTTELMIDLETLSTSTDPSAAVISIGICAFDGGGILDSEGYAIRPDDWHGYIDPKTIRWWMDQSEDAKKFSFGGKIHDWVAAQALDAFIVKHLPSDTHDQRVWAKDPDFDLVLLKAWLGRVNKRVVIPWRPHYASYRSVRTVFDLARDFTGRDPMAEVGMYVAHNPVDDACAQARAVIAARDMLRPKGFVNL